MTPFQQDTLRRAINKVLGVYADKIFNERDEINLIISKDLIVDVLQMLKDSPETAFQQLMDITAVDYPARQPRFDVAYQLLSLSHNWRMTILVAVEDGHKVPSVISVYPSAGWYEREVFDLFGIVFTDHPDLRRLLTDYGFEGHPMRRDFPLIGHVQVRYDDLERKVVQEPVKLESPSRDFDFTSPWQGMTHVQRREHKE